MTVLLTQEAAPTPNRQVLSKLQPLTDLQTIQCGAGVMQQPQAGVVAHETTSLGKQRSLLWNDLSVLCECVLRSLVD